MRTIFARKDWTEDETVPLLRDETDSRKNEKSRLCKERSTSVRSRSSPKTNKSTRTRSMSVMVDVRIFLTMLILVLVLGLSKNVLQTIGFLSEKITKDQDVSPLPSLEKPKG